MDVSSSKIWALVEMISGLHDRVLLFAQWKDLLRLVRDALQSADVRALLLEGTVLQRASLIEQFVAKDDGVMLICVQDSFAGLHLPCAKNIIFAHALVGEVGRVQTWEHQAVARTLRPGCSDDVRVCSVVLADTQEELLWHSTRLPRQAIGAQATVLA